MQAVTTENYKFIDTRPGRGRVQPGLYDLRTDPGELNNILDEQKDLANEFRESLR